MGGSRWDKGLMHLDALQSVTPAEPNPALTGPPILTPDESVVTPKKDNKRAKSAPLKPVPPARMELSMHGTPAYNSR